MGCTLLRKCHEGACTYGIATQDPELRKRFAGKPEYFSELPAVCGRRGTRRSWPNWASGPSRDGRPRRSAEDAPPSSTTRPEGWIIGDFPSARGRIGPSRCNSSKTGRPTGRSHGLADSRKGDAGDGKGKPVTLDLPIKNTNRTVGTILSNRMVKKFGPTGLKDDHAGTDVYRLGGAELRGVPGPGRDARLIGDSNDYLGKGSQRRADYRGNAAGIAVLAHENIIVGNTLLYGATRGEVFINGMAGERFAVRNSGATAVVEGVGDHGCEYMTGGLVVVLGQTGCNFAAGMSGGIAYVLDEMQLFDTLCNLDMVELESVWKRGGQVAAVRPDRPGTRTDAQFAGPADPGRLAGYGRPLRQGHPD
jgi:glutamate synthase (NADPH) large chain